MFSDKIGNWKKVIAGFAGFGFILSFILGIIGRVLIGAILLRAFIFAIVFAGISFLIMKMIEIFIPELLVPDTDEDDSAAILGTTEDEDPADVVNSGNNLDITVEDEQEINYADDAGEFGELETIEADSLSEATVAKAPAASVEPAGDIEELEEVGFAEDESPAELVEELQGAESSAATGGDRNLPDIGAFSDSFEQSIGSVESDGLSNIDGTGRSGAEILGGMHDTEEIVKAVKTVLKKDQEG
jgi:hypothetical protein